MINPRFYTQTRSYTLKEICEIINSSLPEDCDPNKEIVSIAKLNEAKETDLTFFHNQKYINDLKTTKAYACIISSKFKDYLPNSVIPIIVSQPYLALGYLLKKFYTLKHAQIEDNIGISEKASISKRATIGKNCRISDFVVIEDDAIIGDGTFIGPHVTILNGVTIGKNSYIESNVTIGFATIGDNAYIKAGARIGQQGFGFYAGQEGIIDIIQLGSVIIGNNTQIGANCTIDRGSMGDTIIGNNVRIDDMVHIAHNVEIGSNCIIAAQTGIAGSTKIGNALVCGGQVGIAGHLVIGDNVTIAAKSGAMKDTASNTKVAGIPAQNITNWHRQTILLKRLGEGKAEKL